MIFLQTTLTGSSHFGVVERMVEQFRDIAGRAAMRPGHVGVASGCLLIQAQPLDQEFVSF